MEVIEEVFMSDDEVEFYIEEAPNIQPFWSTAPKEIKPYYIITDNVYPEFWGDRKILSKTIE